MQIRVLVKLGKSYQKVESFGSNRYLVYLLSEDHKSGNVELINIISKKLGVPLSKIEFRNGLDTEEKTLELG